MYVSQYVKGIYYKKIDGNHIHVKESYFIHEIDDAGILPEKQYEIKHYSITVPLRDVSELLLQECEDKGIVAREKVITREEIDTVLQQMTGRA